MDLFDKYFSLIEKLSSQKGVYGVYLFGKYAKNKATFKSDLDICFIIDKYDKNLEIELLSHKTDNLDISIFHNLPLNIKFDIIKTGKLIFCTNKDKVKTFKMQTLRQYKEESWVSRKIYARRYGVQV